MKQERPGPGVLIVPGLRSRGGSLADHFSPPSWDGGQCPRSPRTEAEAQARSRAIGEASAAIEGQ